jgi:hypothetical protein
MEQFMIRNKENACRLTECLTYDEAYLQIQEWETEDKEDGSYKKNFYEIYDIKNKKVI